MRERMIQATSIISMTDTLSVPIGKPPFFGFSEDSPDKPENLGIIRYFAFLNKAHTPTRTTAAAKTKPTMLPAPVNMLPNW